MKGRLRAVIITLVVLAVGTGVLLWHLSTMLSEITGQEENNLAEERDLVSEQDGKAIDSVKELDIIPLYLSGEDKNVVTTQFASVSEIYSAEKSAEVEETLETMRKNKSFTLEDALWAYNPYGTNRASMYVYFKTSGKCYCRYTISVKDSAIPDFTRSPSAYGSEKLTKEHEYQIIGLVPGKTNYITMNLYTSKDELSETYTFSVTMPESSIGAKTILNTTEGVSKTTISNGLYVVFQNGKKKSGNKRKYAILLYDNSGVLRAEIPTNRYIGRNMEIVYDTLLYSVSDTELVQVDAIGQVTNVVSLTGYRQSGEFAYDGYGNVYLIATADEKKATVQSKVVKVTLETGEITLMADMDILLKKVYEDAGTRDWIGLNSIQVTGTNEFIVSAKKLSSVIKVSNAGSLMTQVDYILADASLYSSYKGLRKKVLTKTVSEDEEAAATETPAVENILHDAPVEEAFASQYGQDAISYEAGQTEGQYTLTLLNCNSGKGADANGESYHCTYLIDETAGTYMLTDSTALDQTKKDGNVAAGEESYVYCCSDEKLFAELDWDGKLICQYEVSRRTYRVYKCDFKDFWFY